MSNSPNMSEEIARTAYELYKERGMADGNDLADWLKAERIVQDRVSAKAKDQPAMPVEAVKLQGEKKKTKKTFTA